VNYKNIRLLGLFVIVFGWGFASLANSAKNKNKKRQTTTQISRRQSDSVQSVQTNSNSSERVVITVEGKNIANKPQQPVKLQSNRVRKQSNAQKLVLNKVKEKLGTKSPRVRQSNPVQSVQKKFNTSEAAIIKTQYPQPVKNKNVFDKLQRSVEVQSKPVRTRPRAEKLVINNDNKSPYTKQSRPLQPVQKKSSIISQREVVEVQHSQPVKQKNVSDKPQQLVKIQSHQVESRRKAQKLVVNKVKERSDSLFNESKIIDQSASKSLPIKKASAKRKKMTCKNYVVEHVSVQSHSNIIPLHAAAQQGCVENIEKLLEAGVNPDEETIEINQIVNTSKAEWKKALFGGDNHVGDKVTPLFTAVLGGQTEIVKTLAPRSYVNNRVGSFDATLLHMASLLGHDDIVKLLVQNNANFNLLLRGKYSAADIACDRKKYDLAMFLYAQMHDFNQKMAILRSLDPDIALDRPLLYKDIPFGVYCRGIDGQLISVPKYIKSDEGLVMISNHLSKLCYGQCPKKRMHNDTLHNFSEDIEKTFGGYSWVVVDSKGPDKLTDNKKKFTLHITLPGEVIKEQGVFEFTVWKTLYEERGVCLHRFLNPKGELGAQEFGAKYRAKEQRRLTNF